MNLKEYTIHLDIKRGILNPQNIQFVTEDYNAYELKFKLLEDKITPYDLTGCVVRLVAKAPNMLPNQQDCVVTDASGGLVTVTLSQSMFEVEARYTAELQVYDSANQTKRLTAPRFTYMVSNSIMDDETVQADPNFSILQDMILKVGNADATATEALDKANEAMTKSNQAVTTINNQITRVDQAVEDVNEALDRAESVVTQEELANKIKIGDREANFNFNERKVVQQGLVKQSTGVIQGTFLRDLDLRTGFTLCSTCDFSNINGPETEGTAFLFNFGFTTAERLQIRTYKGRVLASTVDKGTIPSNIEILQPEKIISDLWIRLNNKELTISTQGVTKVIDISRISMDTLANLSIDSSYTKASNVLYYNRVLSNEEIQNISQVVNNSRSIDNVSIINKDGVSKNYILSSDSEHVTMRNGYNLEQFATSIMNRDKETFTSTDGSPITIHNGMEYSKILSGEIKGQTVMNYCSRKASEFTMRYGGTPSFDAGNNTMTLSSTSEGAIDIHLVQLEANTTYTLVTNILKNNSLAACNLLHANGVFSRNIGIGAGVSGLSKNLIVTLPDVGTDMGKPHIYYGVTGGGDNKIVLQGYLILKGDWTTKPDAELIEMCKNMGGGLNSTQAIINNNGQSYPIYEPTIQGHTKVMKAPKGTQNWVEISIDEIRDTVTYDYKLESINGDLGSVPNIADYVDVSSKVKIINTSNDLQLTGTEIFTTIGSVGSNMFAIGLDLNNIVSNNTIGSIISNSLIVTHGLITNIPAQECVRTGASSSNRCIVILKGTNRAEAIARLSELKPVIRYQLATPTEAPLTDEEMRAYDEYKKVISLSKAGGTCDTLDIKSGGDTVYSKKLSALDLLNDFSRYQTLEASNLNKNYLAKYNPQQYKNSPPSSQQSGDVLCNKLKRVNLSDMRDRGEEGIVSYTDGTMAYNNIYVGLKWETCGILETDTIDQRAKKVGEWVAKNDIKVVIPTAPEYVYIPKEITPVISVNKTNICRVGDGVNPSSFKLVAPVDRTAELLARVEALEAKTNTMTVNVPYVEETFAKSKNKIEEVMLNV